MPTSKTVRVSWNPEQIDPTRFLAGASPREWERWMELGGMMPDLLEVARLLIEARAEQDRKRREMLANAESARTKAQQRAANIRHQFKATSGRSPAWKPLPRKSAG